MAIPTYDLNPLSPGPRIADDADLIVHLHPLIYSIPIREFPLTNNMAVYLFVDTER